MLRVGEIVIRPKRDYAYSYAQALKARSADLFKYDIMCIVYISNASRQYRSRSLASCTGNDAGHGMYDALTRETTIFLAKVLQSFYTVLQGFYENGSSKSCDVF